MALDTERGLHANTFAPFKLQEAGGYSSFYPDRVNRLMSYMQFGEMSLHGTVFGRWVEFEDFFSPLFDLLNVRYVLTSPEHLISGTKYRLVYMKDMAVYENTHVMPRAFAVHRHVVKSGPAQVLRYMGSGDYDMRRELVLEEEPPLEFIEGLRPPSRPPEVSIKGYWPDRVEIDAELSANGWLVLTDTHYPGWKAAVDGKEAPVLRANCNFRAVALAPGRHSVVFRYAPLSVMAAQALTILGFCLVLTGISMSSRRAAK